MNYLFFGFIIVLAFFLKKVYKFLDFFDFAGFFLLSLILSLFISKVFSLSFHFLFLTLFLLFMLMKVITFRRLAKKTAYFVNETEKNYSAIIEEEENI